MALSNGFIRVCTCKSVAKRQILSAASHLLPEYGYIGQSDDFFQLAKFFIGVLPSLIFYSVAGATPVMVYYLVRWIGYHTR